MAEYDAGYNDANDDNKATILALQAQNTKLEKQLAFKTMQFETAERLLNEQIDKTLKSNARNLELLKALKFYADEKNWRTSRSEPYVCNATDDGGDIAQKALDCDPAPRCGCYFDSNGGQIDAD